MFQIGLISALASAVLLVSLFLSSRQRSGVAGPHEARRVLVALERASWTALRRRAVRLPAALTIAIACVLLAQLALRSGKAPASLTAFVAAPLLVLLGAVFGLTIAGLTLLHVRSCASSIWSGLFVSSSRAISSCWSASMTVLIAGEAAGILSIAGLYGLLRLFAYNTSLFGASAASQPSSSALAAAQLTAYFGIGAAIAALWLQQMGSTCVGAVLLGAGSDFATQTGLKESDPRNPSVLLDALSRQLGEVLPRVLDAFVTSCVVSTLTLLLLHHPLARTWLPEESPLATIPLLLRVFGLLSSLFALLTIRATEHENLALAVTRSQLVGHAVFASATAGTILWIVGSWSFPVLASAACGVALPGMLSYARSLGKSQIRFRRNTKESTAVGHPTQRTELLGEALIWVAILPMTIYAAVLLFALVGSSHVEGGPVVAALLIGLASPVAMTSFHAAAGVASSILTAACLSVRLGRLATTEASERRLQRLTTTLEQLALRFDPLVTDGGMLLCGLAAMAIAEWTGPFSPLFVAPAVIALLLIVAMQFLVSAGNALRKGASSARTLGGEVERQLRGLKREGNLVRVPDDFVPSYRSCVELLARDAAQGGLLPVVLSVALPLLVSFAGTGTENSPGLRATLLAMYLSVAAATGLAVLHAGHAAPLASSLANRHRMGRLPAGTEVEVRPSSFELVDFLRRSTAISVPLLTKATTLVALAFAAMLT